MAGHAFHGDGGEAVHAETESGTSAAIAAVNLGTAAGVFAVSHQGEGVHAEGNGSFAGVAAVSRGSGAGVFAKGLAGGVGCQAESEGRAPALNGIAFGDGAGVFAKSHGGGPAAFLDGDVVITGAIRGNAETTLASLRDSIDQLRSADEELRREVDQVRTGNTRLNTRLSAVEVLVKDLQLQVGQLTQALATLSAQQSSVATGGRSPSSGRTSRLLRSRLSASRTTGAAEAVPQARRDDGHRASESEELR